MLTVKVCTLKADKKVDYRPWFVKLFSWMLREKINHRYACSGFVTVQGSPEIKIGQLLVFNVRDIMLQFNRHLSGDVVKLKVTVISNCGPTYMIHLVSTEPLFSYEIDTLNSLSNFHANTEHVDEDGLTIIEY